MESPQRQLMLYQGTPSQPEGENEPRIEEVFEETMLESVKVSEIVKETKVPNEKLHTKPITSTPILVTTTALESQSLNLLLVHLSQHPSLIKLHDKRVVNMTRDKIDQYLEKVEKVKNVKLTKIEIGKVEAEEVKVVKFNVRDFELHKEFIFGDFGISECFLLKPKKNKVVPDILRSLSNKSSTKKLLTPFEEPKQVLHSTRKLFKTTSLDYSSSPEFNLFSDLKNQSEEEVIEAMMKPTIKEYMMKTPEDYGSSIAKHMVDEKAHFELKEDNFKQILSNKTHYQAWERFKELLLRCPQHYLTDMQEVILFYKGLDVPTRQILNSKGVIQSMKATDTNKAIQDMADHSQKWHNGTPTRTRSTKTFDGLAAIQSQLNNLVREIKKVNEKVYAAQVGCESCGGPHYTKDCPLKKEGKTFKEAYYTQFGRHDENSNLIKEIRASMDASIRNQGASIKALEIQIWKMSKVLQEKGYRSLPGSTKTNPRDHVKSISNTVEADMPSIHRIDPIRYAVSRPYNIMQFCKPSQSIIPFSSRLIDDCSKEKMVLVELKNKEKSSTNLKKLLMEKSRMGHQIEASTNMHESAILKDSLPPKEKDQGFFTIPCYINNICFEKALADLGASVSVMPYSTFTNLGLGEIAPTKLIIELADRTIKCPKCIAKDVLAGMDKFVFPVNFIILDMPEDIKVPLIFGRPFLSTAHAKINVFKRKITLRVGDDKIVFKSDNLTSNIIKRVFALGLREQMKLNLEVRLMGEALILYRSLDHVYGDYIELDDLNEPLELRRNQIEDIGITIEEGEVIDEPIEDIVKTRNEDNKIIVENMDAYGDKGMGDVIVGKPFCREICVKARRFDGMITIYNGNVGLYCNGVLPEGVKFIENKVIEEPEFRLIFVDEFGDPSFQRKFVELMEKMISEKLDARPFEQESEIGTDGPGLSKSIDSDILFDIAGRTLLLGRVEFCLVTGFACGKQKNKAGLEEAAKATKGKAAQPSDKGDKVSVTIRDLGIIFSRLRGKKVVPAFMLRLVNDLSAWDDFPWGEYYWEEFHNKDSNPTTKLQPTDVEMGHNWYRKSYDCLDGKEKSIQLDDFGLVSDHDDKSDSHTR
nr:hypothetical protein [Tanacetum cinerariifolium]